MLACRVVAVGVAVAAAGVVAPNPAFAAGTGPAVVAGSGLTAAPGGGVAPGPGGAVAGPGGAAVGPGGAAVGPGGGPVKPKTDLTLGYMADAGYAAAVRLTCTAGDVHPQAKKTCATLKKAGGDPGKITPAKTMCTMEFAPVTATATGTFLGKSVNWKAQFGNACEMRRATGVLFTF